MRLGLKCDYLFLIIPNCIIIPRLETHIATHYWFDYSCMRHFFNSLLSILGIVFVALIKTYSHKNALNRDALRA